MGDFNLIIEPDEDDDEAASIYVEVLLGESVYRFLLDTGAGSSSLIQDEYTYAFERTGEHQSSGVFATSLNELVVVPEIRLGPVIQENFEITRLPANSPDLRNLLGMDLLKDHQYYFLFDQQRVLVDPEEQPDMPLFDLFLGKKFHPYVEIGLGERQVRGVWDTGASLTIVDHKLIAEFPTFFREDGTSYGIDSTGAQMDTPMYRMHAAQIGNQIFPSHRVAGVDLSFVNSTTETPMDFILGYSTLRLANWWIDFPGKKWGLSNLPVIESGEH